MTNRIDLSGETHWIEENARLRSRIAELEAAVLPLPAPPPTTTAIDDHDGPYRRLIENMTDVVWVLDPVRLRWTYISPAVFQLRGYTAAEVLAQPLSAAFTPEAGERFMAGLAERLRWWRSTPEAAQSHVDAVDQLHRDGRIISTEVTTRYVLNAHGEPEVLGVTRALSGRWPVAAPRGVGAALSTAPPVAVLKLDSAARITFASEPGREWLALANTQAVIGRSLLDWVAVHDRDRAWQDLHTAASRDQSLCARYQLSDAAGGGTWGELQAFQMPDAPRGLPGLVVVLRDISSEVATEQSQRTDEADVRALLDGNPFVTMLCEGDGRIRAINARGAQWLGRSPDDLIGQSIFARTPAEVAVRRRAYLAQALQTGQLVHYLDERDGRLVDNYIQPIPDRSGAGARAAILAVDVTDRAKAEELMRLQSAALEHTANAIVIADTQGRIAWTNPAWTRLTGYSPAEAAGQILTVVHAGHSTAADPQQAWQQLLAGIPWEGEGVGRRKDGGVYDEFQVLTPVRNAQGAITHVVGIHQEVTARRAAERQIDEERQRYKVLLQTSRDAIHVLDQSGRLRDWNEAFLEHLGYTAAEAANLNVANWDVQWDAVEVIHKIGDFIREGALFETRHRRKDGRLRVVEINAVGVTLDGERYLYAAARDVTERKQADDRLRESERRLRQAENVAQMGHWRWESDTDRLLGSEGLWRLLQLGPDTPYDLRVAQWIRCVVAPDEQERAQAQFQEMCAAIRPAPFELSVRQGASRRQIRITPGDEEYDPAGRRISITGIAQDVSAQRQAEAQLRASEERYRQLVDSSPEGILLHRAGTIEYSNPMAAAILGAGQPQDLVGRRLLDFVHPDYRTTVTQRVQEIQSDQHSVPWIQERLIRLDGHVIDAEVAGRPVDLNGVIYSQAVFRDISERRQMEARLRESEALFRALFEKNSAAKLLLSPTDGAIVDANPAAAEFYGYSMAELKQLTLQDLGGGALEKDLAPLDLPEASRPSRLEFTHRLAGGEAREIEVYATPLVVGGDRLVYAILHDVTDRKRAEAQVRASLQEKDALLKEVHHRVKNNLQVMISLLALQAERVTDPATQAILRDSQERVRSMALVHEQLYRSADMANIDFAQYLTELVGGLRRVYAAHQGIELAVEPVWLSVNVAIPCGLIVNELVSNALKYAYPDGKGAVRIGLTRMPERSDGPVEVCLTVSDDGVGLPAGLNPAAGETLGLRLVQVLIRQLRGTLGIQSPPGTTFEVRFGTH